MTDTENTTSGVRNIQEMAMASVRLAALLKVAVDMLRTGAPKGTRKKLNRKEALAATLCVTNMLKRFELPPCATLLKPGRTSMPSATSRFYCSRREMEPDHLPSPKRRYAKGLDAHDDNVRLIANHARDKGHNVDEDALLDELAEAVLPFVEQFRNLVWIDPDVELARDISLIPNWISNPRRGFELSRILGEAEHQELVFDARTGEMEFMGDAASLCDGNTPSIPLLLRAVAVHDVEMFEVVKEDGEPKEEVGPFDFLRKPKLELIGKSSCLVCNKVGLGIVPDRERRGGLRMVFTLDPVTYVGLPEWDKGAEDWRSRGFARKLVQPGIPVPGRHMRIVDDEHWFLASPPTSVICPEHGAFVEKSLCEESGYEDEALLTRRWMSVTPESCRLIFDEAALRYAWTWTILGRILEESVMPRSAVTETGVETWTARDRFSALLYASEEPSAAGLLLVEAGRRIEAFDRFQARTATGDRMRKLAFRVRMRK